MVGSAFWHLHVCAFTWCPCPRSVMMHKTLKESILQNVNSSVPAKIKASQAHGPFPTALVSFFPCRV